MRFTVAVALLVSSMVKRLRSRNPGLEARATIDGLHNRYEPRNRHTTDATYGVLVVKGTMIKAVLFDLGETLLNFGKVDTLAVFRESARLTHNYLVSCDQPAGGFRGYYLRNLFAIQIRSLWANVTGRDFDALSLLKQFGEKRGVRLDQEHWRQIGWLWYEPLSKLGTVEEDIKETLTKLRDMGLKLGILSNTFISSGSLDRHLAQLGILDFFPYRFYSYQFKFRKPDRRIFEAAVAAIGEETPNILFVGDRINKDITPALRAGMPAVLKSAYTNRGKAVPAGVRKIERIAELPGIIEGINGKNVTRGPSLVTRK